MRASRECADGAAYKKFERVVIHDYAPETAVERALVVRVASLLWRLRRAVAIESGLFQIQAEIMRDRHLVGGHEDANHPLKVFYDLLRHPRLGLDVTEDTVVDEPKDQMTRAQEKVSSAAPRAAGPVETATCFLRLENFNPAKLDLIGRYETRLWRQLAQTILLIESTKRGKFMYRTRAMHFFR